MRIIGVDPSMTSTGVASVNDLASGVRTSTMAIASKPPKRAKGDKAKATIVERYQRSRIIADAVFHAACPLGMAPPTLVVIEEPLHGTPGGSNFDRAGLWWMIVARFLAADIPVAQVNVTRRTMWAAGRGGADKASVAVAVAKMWPDATPECDDEWDALAFATMGAQHLGWIPTLARHQAELDKIIWPDVPAGVEMDVA